MTVVGGSQESTSQGLGDSIQTLAAFFCANGGLVASPESARLHGAFNILTGLFDRLVLQTKKVKTVSTAFRPCHTTNAWSTEAYTW